MMKMLLKIHNASRQIQEKHQ